ncbi:mpv17-like protein isoform X4 [Lethenteron reissneri]|uniref:mpv17-like protein isoform X4 n=1 Tax=Lethenteron reissneri TaxID=7753 RepID=UPI002AB646FB|nr:mpv17-like protein isoform X4 [Lethenteron reissneri]
MNTIATWVRRHSWLSSVAAFGILFAGADAVQQRFLGPPPPPSHHQRPPHHPDGARTARAALLGLAFHGNFNYVWLRGLERAIPGSAARAVVVKVLADQTVAGPITISAFFTDGRCLLVGNADHQLHAGASVRAFSVCGRLCLLVDLLPVLRAAAQLRDRQGAAAARSMGVQGAARGGARRSGAVATYVEGWG